MLYGMTLCAKGLHDLDLPNARESYSVVGGGGKRTTSTRCRACSIERKQTANRRRWVAIKDRFMEMYGGRCACCGITRRIFLSLDHIDGGGNAQRKASGQRGAYLDATRKYQPKVYRILCHNCNMAMEHEENHTCLTPGQGLG
jgi:hypothetical protein